MVDIISLGVAAAAQAELDGNAKYFDTKMLCQSDTPIPTPITINGVTAQYSRITNYCIDGGAGSGSGAFGAGILQVKWSNDTKGIENTICKSRATTIGGTPVAIQAGDVIFTELWYGDAGPTVGAPTGSMAHIGWYRVAIDGAPLGDSTELPGWYGLATGSGLHSPGSRYAFEINSKQQVHFPGRTSAVFGPTGTSYGANFVLGVGDAAMGGAPFKFTLTSAALLTVPEPAALEVDSAGILYTTNAVGQRRSIATSANAGSTASIQELIFAARVKGYTTSYTNTNKIDSVVTKDGFLGLVLHAYTSNGTGSWINGTSYTIPSGRVAILLYAEGSIQSSFFKSEIYNATSATTKFNFASPEYVPSGSVLPDVFNSTVTYPFQIGVAGDTIYARVTSAGDGTSRTVWGEFIIAIVNPNNPSTFYPG